MLITSVANQRVKDAVALQRKKERDATGLYLVEGPNAVAEALAEGLVLTVFATEEHATGYEGAHEAEVVSVADHVLERIATSRAPQGVVAVAHQRPAALSEVLGHGFVIVCHDASDPGNAGAIIRTADAAGAAGVILTGASVDPFNPKAVRASTGSITRLPVVVDAGLDEVLVTCRERAQRVLALDTDGSQDIHAADLAAPVALLFGSEAHGLPQRALDQVDETVAIPRYGRAESLNLAAAVAVASYAVARVVHGSSAPVETAPLGTDQLARESS